MEYKDYYKIMGVARDATEAQIKQAYRKLARKYHPDVSKEKDAEARFKEVGEAYDVSVFIGVKLFRWEKEEKLRPAAKFWLLAVLGPFFLLGAWQMHAKTNIAKAKVLGREVQRSRNALIRDARLFLGDGTVIDQGSVLIKDGKIAEIYTGPAPDAKSLRADAIEAAGKTLLPGLIDVHVHLGSPGGPVYQSDRLWIAERPATGTGGLSLHRDSPTY